MFVPHQIHAGMYLSPLHILIHLLLFYLFYLQNDQEKLWKLGKLNHVAIAVPDLGKFLI